MSLTAQQIRDLVTSTLNDLGRMRFGQIAQSFVDYEVMSKIMKKEKVQFDGGQGIQRTLMVDHSNAAKNVGLYAKDAVNVGDVLKNITIPWRHTTTNYAYEQHEIAMNASDATKIVSLLKVRRADAMLSLIELMEANFWGSPASSADKTTPFGLPYWVVKNATEGFNGGNPAADATGAGGLDHAKWKNYTAQYAAVTKADLIKKMRRAMRRTSFKSPIDIPDYRNGKGQRYRIYTNEAVLEAAEDLGESQNENLGRDLASMDGSITFKRSPIVHVPYLDADTANPVYMLDLAYINPVFLKGFYLRESTPKEAPEQHLVDVVHVDMTWNMLCTDRRRQSVLYK